MPNVLSNRLKGILSMTGGALAFASMAALMKTSLENVPIFQVVAIRGVIGWLVLALYDLVRHGRVRRGTNRRRLFWRSLFGFGGIATYVWAIAHIDLGVASALNQSSPVFAALLSILLLRERPPRSVPALILVAFAGAVLIVAPDLRGVDWHALVGLFSGISAAIAYVMVRQLRHTDPPVVIIRWFCFWSAALSFPFIAAQEQVLPAASQWPVLLAMGLFGLVGQLGMTFAYRLEQASIVSPFMYVSVLGSLTLGWLVWREWPGPVGLVGCGLVVASSGLVGWLTARRRGPSTPPELAAGSPVPTHLPVIR